MVSHTLSRDFWNRLLNKLPALKFSSQGEGEGEEATVTGGGGEEKKEEEEES